MIIGWAINSAMILLAAATFFAKGQKVDELQQAKRLLEPLLGSNASVVFAVALLFAGVASTITSGMAGGSIVSGMYKEPYTMLKIITPVVGGLLFLWLGALIMIFFIGDPV
jgi:manganese transport protein